MAETVIELRKKQAKIFTDMQEILEIADKEDREITKDEETRWNKFDEDYESISAKIKIQEKMEQRQAEIDAEEAKPIGEPEQRTEEKDKSKELKERRDNIWLKYMISGMDFLEPEERKILHGMRTEDSEIRALTTTTGASGGFTVPEGFSNRVEEALKAFGGVREVATPFPTATGNDIPWPNTNDTGNKGERLAENTAANEQDVVWASQTLKSFIYSSKMIKVPVTLLQDSAFNLNEWLPGKLAERVGRILNEEMTTGAGTTLPEGIVTGSVLGKTVALNSAITAQELIDLEHSVDPAYRMNATWMFNDDTLKAIKKLVDGQGNFLWNRGNVIDGAPSTFMGYPYVINQDMAGIATVSKSVLFGDLSKYMIRDVEGQAVLRLTERFAESWQVAFLMFSRHDGQVVDAGDGPIRHIIHPI